MRYFLSWPLFVQLRLSEPYSNSENLEGYRARQDDKSKLESPTPPVDQNSPRLEGRGETATPGLAEERDDAPTDTKTYVVSVADRNNESQINETRKWLERLVKDKSKMNERVSFVWEKPEEVPYDELQKLWDEGRYDEEIEKYDRTNGWSGLVLDSAGYDEVSKKTEWIKEIHDQGRWVSNPHSEPLEPKLTIPMTLLSRAEESATKKYRVSVTDSENFIQVNETREWLFGLAKNKREISELTSFPWIVEKDIPTKELEDLWDDGRYDEEIDSYLRVDGWHNVELDAAGCDEVSRKTEWIKSITQYERLRVVGSPILQPKKTT